MQTDVRRAIEIIKSAGLDDAGPEVMQPTDLANSKPKLYRLEMQCFDEDRMRSYLNAKLSAETVEAIETILAEATEAILAEEDDQLADVFYVCDARQQARIVDAATDLSIDALATELEVTRRTIERALKDGLLVPTSYKGKRVRFNREYADKLKARAQEARSMGCQHVIGIAAGSGPITGAVQIRRRPEMTAEHWARVARWKRRNFPRQPRPKTADGAKTRVVRAPLTPEQIEERAKRRLEKKRDRLRTHVFHHMGPPQSKDQALESLEGMRRLVRTYDSPEAKCIEKCVAHFHRSLAKGKVNDRDIAALRQSIPEVKALDRGSAVYMALALGYLADWSEQSRTSTSGRLRG